MNWTIETRPKLFKEVYGNQKAIQELQKRSKDQNFSKVILFIGNTGTGKSSLSLIVAKAMLCDNLQENGEPCNNCKFCNMIDNKTPNEYINFYHGGNLGIEEIRGLGDFANRKILGKQKKKIILIEELQDISNTRALQNALLLLEKENDNTYFIISSMSKLKLSDAAIDRTLVYNLKLDYKDIRECLVNIIKKENITPTIELANMITAITNNCNSLRKAIGMLERVVLSELKTEEELYQELGIMSETKIIDFINGLLKGDIQILQIKPDQNLLDQIKQKLVLFYEYNCGLELNAWQKQQLQGINKTDNLIIETIMSILQELTLFPYLNQTIIEFQLVKCITNVKKLLEQNNFQNIQKQINKEVNENTTNNKVRRGRE